MLVVFFHYSIFFYLLLNRNQITITLKFTSRFLHPAEASLLLISRPKSGIGGTTMIFALKGEVLNFKAIVSKSYLFYDRVFASLLKPWTVPSTAVLPSYISWQLLFFEIMCICRHRCVLTYICVVFGFCISDIFALILFLWK